jgi:hypothetical protein
MCSMMRGMRSLADLQRAPGTDSAAPSGLPLDVARVIL